MRRGTKKCILLLLAILLFCLLAWRLTPHTFEQMTASDRDEITSLAGVVSLSGVRDGRGVSLMLVWGPSEDECCSLSLSGRQIAVSRPHHDGFLIYHPEDPKLLNWLAIYLANNGEKG